METAERSKPNPYPGPRPFRAGENLYGRDREITQLFYLLSAERIVVLHSPSGAGKSSLLHAGLLPRLQRERFDVWPSIRLSAPAADARNRFVRSAVLSLEEGLPPKRQRPVEKIAGQTLVQYIAERPRRPGAPSSVVLLFDQFEEIVTLDSIAVEAKQEFFQQLGNTLKNPDVWALFAIREDYLAQLDPYRDDVPTRLNNTFRIDLLTVKAGLEAITRPAHAAGRQFAAAAADKLVNDLATVSIQQPDGSFSQVPGRYVEPVQLQVVCRRLWDELPGDIQTIGVEHLQASGDVNSALAAYYEQCVARIAHGDAPYERRLREWFNERLITPGGIRGQVLREKDASGGLDNKSIDRLLDTHLVRAEQRAGATWYELAHDRLVVPVKSSNIAWFDKNLHPMQRQAATWDREGRPDRLLLRGQDLKEAESWARANASSVLLIEEKDLLARSATQRRAARTKVGAIAFVICILLIGLAVVSWLRQQALEQSRRAMADNLASTSELLLRQGDLTRALRVAQAAYDIDKAEPSADRALTDDYPKVIFDHEVPFERILPHHQPVTSVVYSPDGSRILTTSGDDIAKLWDKNGNLIREMTHKDEQGVKQCIHDAAFFHDSSGIITVGCGHLVQMWNRDGIYVKDFVGHGNLEQFVFTLVAIAPNDATIVTFSSHEYSTKAIVWNRDGTQQRVLDVPHDNQYGRISHVAFSPNGKYFATSGYDWNRTVQLYDVRGQLIKSLSSDPCSEGVHWDCAVSEVAFSPTDESLWLAAFTDRTVRQYDVEGNLRRTIKTDHTGRINSVVFSPDGQYFLTASNDHTAILWNKDGSVKHLLTGHADAVRTAIFSPDGKYIATASSDGTAKLWDLDGNILATYGGHRAGIQSVQFSPDMKNIVTASGDKTAILWPTRSPLAAAILKDDGEVVSARFLPDGKRILTASNDMTVRLWSAEDTTKPVRTYDKIFGPDNYNNKRINSLDISRDGDRFITTGTDYTVRIWEVKTGKVIKDWVYSEPDSCNHDGWCGATNARYSNDGKYIVTSDFGGVVKIFDKDGTFLRSIRSPDNVEINGIAVSPDDKYLATGSNDMTIKLWDFETGRLQHTLLGHTGPVGWVEFSATGDEIVSGSGDQTVKVWDLQGKNVLDIDAHAGAVRSVEFSPHDQQIISASEDGTAKIWDMKGQLVRALEGHKAYLRAAFFSPHGDEVITASGDDTAVIWPNAEGIDKWLCDADIYRLTPEDWKKLGLQDYPRGDACP